MTDTETVGTGYTAADIERRVPEPSKRPGRTAFERDRARVLHSAAFRRLSAKTQVVAPGSDDFVRNRLTHSLEVAQVARELGRALGCAPDVVETAALAHDLGHPPFGHNGERALHEAVHDIGGFEGNAQTFSILVRLEPKTLDDDGRSVGLNLTRAVLDACAKYPWTLDSAPAPVGVHADGSSAALRKFGAYAEDADVFAWMRAAAQDTRRCLEAQVMDLADDIAYSVHDVEDAVASGHVDLQVLAAPQEIASVFEAVRDWYLPDAADDELQAALGRLTSLQPWPDDVHDGGLRSQARLKSLTSALIGRFCTATQEVTHATYGSGRLTRFAADLLVPPEIRAEIAVLKGIAAHYVMRRDDRVALLAGQRAALTELVQQLGQRPDALEPLFSERYAAAGDDRARRRVVVDQVASLTDRSAVAWLQRLRG
ncbi:MAG: deoxyguanosinetriphosphate triphosphohydrolase [Actinomycetota bacterium]|nr:deoxyguanosinetriphosphate triphosphohydrolase [Actinomycetota bacterium]